jgi:peptide/nickel transport system substrate-binding protein
VQGASGAFGNCATAAESFTVKGGTYVYGNYPDIDALFAEQAAEMDRAKREKILHRLQQLVHEKAIFAPIWQQAFISGIGPKVGQSGFEVGGIMRGSSLHQGAPHEELHPQRARQ